MLTQRGFLDNGPESLPKMIERAGVDAVVVGEQDPHCRQAAGEAATARRNRTLMR